eukprot:9761182-Ditylum_brightwellii.AAC.1
MFYEGKLGPLQVLESTVWLTVKRIKAGEEISIKAVFGKESKGLLSCENCQVLQDIIAHCDEGNNGMDRREITRVIADMIGCSSTNTTENHYDYLIWKKRLTELKRDGCV